MKDRRNHLQKMESNLEAAVAEVSVAKQVHHVKLSLIYTLCCVVGGGRFKHLDYYVELLSNMRNMNMKMKIPSASGLPTGRQS